MTDDGTTSALPGFLAFVAFAFLALALWFLMRNMNARMRRMSYRQKAANRGKDDPQAGPSDTSSAAVAGGTSGSGDPGPTPGHGGHHGSDPSPSPSDSGGHGGDAGGSGGDSGGGGGDGGGGGGGD